MRLQHFSKVQAWTCLLRLNNDLPPPPPPFYLKMQVMQMQKHCQGSGSNSNHRVQSGTKKEVLCFATSSGNGILYGCFLGFFFFCKEILKSYLKIDSLYSTSVLNKFARKCFHTLVSFSGSALFGKCKVTRKCLLLFGASVSHWESFF